MKKLVFFVILIFVFSLYMFSSSRNLQFEDMFTVGRLSSISISSDNRLIVFAVKTADIKNNSYKTDLFSVNIDGSDLKKISNSKGNNSNPSFINRNNIVFISSRDGSMQLYRKNLSTGDVKKISDVPGGLNSYLWVKSLGKFVFQKDIFPESETLRQSIEKEKALSKSGLKVKVLTSLMYRVWNSWKDGKRSHIFLPLDEGFKDLTPGNYDTPPVDLGGSQDFNFSSDGEKFAYVKNVDKEVAISTNNDIFFKDLKTGVEKNLTKNEKGSDVNPVFSPSSKYLAYISMKRERFEADKHNITLLDLKSGKKNVITKQFKFSVNEFIFSPNGRHIYFTVYESIYHPIYRYTLKNRRIKKIVKDVFASNLKITSNGKKIVFLNQSVVSPKEIFSFNISKKKLSPITNFNGNKIKNIQMNRIERFSFTGAKNERVEGLLIKPPFFKKGKKYPMVFLIHGGPQGAWGDDFHYRWNQNMFASPGYVVVAINFHGSRGYGQDFTDAVTKDWGGAPFMDLVLGQKYAVENFNFIDKDRIAAAGASYGGFMINWIAGNYDKFSYPFKCLISHDGIFDARSMYYSTEELWFEEWEYGGTPWNSSLYEKFNPSRFVQKFKIPILIIHGEKDFRVPVSQGLMLFTAYQRRGIKSKMLYFPDEDHFVRKPKNAAFWWKSVYQWIKENIK